MTIKYEGFTTWTQNVTLSAGQASHIVAALKVATNKEDVQVYAGRQGVEIEAVNRTLTADNIMNVLLSDVITSLPNANVADAIGRLPCVTLERDEGEGKYVKVRSMSPAYTEISRTRWGFRSHYTLRNE